MSVVPASIVLRLGADPPVQLTATPRTSSGKALTGKSVSWRSNASAIATVSATGVVTSAAVGSTQIVATVDGIDGSVPVEVRPVPVGSVAVSIAAPALVQGGTTSVSTVVKDVSGQPLTDRAVTFSSSNTGVATISPTGGISTIAAGLTDVTASVDGVTGSARLCVLASVPNLTVSQVMVSQVVQRADGTIPLVANGLPARVTVFGTANPPVPAGCTHLRVRVTVFNGAQELARLEGPVDGALTTTVNLAAPSYAGIIPGEQILATLRLRAEVNPDHVVPESDLLDNQWPAVGASQPIPVTAVQRLAIRFVPVLLTQGGTVGTVTQASMSEYLFATRQMHPVGEVDVDMGATLSSDVAFGGGELDKYAAILQQLDLIRVAEGTSRYYVGALRPPPGVTFVQYGGIGYIPSSPASTGPGSRTAVLVGVGWFNRQRQTTELVAHELGHTMGLRHAPCGTAASPDPAYPYAGASIGVTGTDMYSYSSGASSVPPIIPPDAAFDVMSYCQPAWISDYNYRSLLNVRQAPLASTQAVATAADPADCLVVWGSVVDGRVELLPAFRMRTRPALPERGGSYTLDVLRADGSALRSIAFEPSELDHAPNIRHFTYAIPLSESGMASVAALRIRGGSRVAELRPLPVSGEPVAPTVQRTTRGIDVRWSRGNYRAAVIVDPVSGSIAGISTSGHIVLPGTYRELDLLLSDGVRTTRVRSRL